MKKKIFKYLKNLLIKNKFKIFNRRNFENKFENSNSKVLIEFNAFHYTHCYMSIITSYFVKMYSANLIAFNNHKLSSTSFEDSLTRKIKWFFGKIFKLKFFGIYSSFGVTDFIDPIGRKKDYKEASKIYNNLISNIKKKSDITKIQIDNILLGDLIYDGYLKLYSLETLDFNLIKFKKYLYNFILLYLYWKNYLINNNVKCIIGVHSVYAYGIIYRIAFSKKIDVFTTMAGRVFRLDYSNQYNYDEYKFFKDIFLKFTEHEKKRFRNYSKTLINKRLDGKVGNDIKELITTKSAFSKFYDKNKNVLSKNKKIKILIATHQLGDACNFWGENFFSDFYEWLKFLSKLSKETDYEWYIKDHPYYSDLKYAKSLDRTAELTRKLVKENNKLIHIPSDISHHQIIEEKIDFVLTIYGTIAFEYAYFKIPVILATKNCPMYKCNMNICPSNLDEYENTLRNLENVKLKINEEDVLDYFFMKYVYNDYDVFFDKHSEFLVKNKWDEYDSFEYYKYWMNNVDLKKLNEMYKIFDNFYKSKKYTIDLSHNNKLLNALKS
tara:strand:- start:457 stop:2109 length:1653 start_codon:yes stop_codon:yes gene_type:complete